jgi:hypothetical protein
MSLVLWTTAASSSGSSCGDRAKAFDAFMLATVIILVGATLEILKRYLPNRRP